jgi:hypothetical protein
MWKHGTLFVLSILAGSPAIAQTQCPELARLRAEAVAAAKPPDGARVLLPTCETSIRISIAWNDAAKYASEHREACDVSTPMLEAIEHAHRAAVKTRDDVCAGRPVMPLRADIIRRE